MEKIVGKSLGLVFVALIFWLVAYLSMLILGTTWQECVGTIVIFGGTFAMLTKIIEGLK